MSRSGGLPLREAEELRQAYAEQMSSLDENMQALNLRDEDLKRERVRSMRRHLLQIQKSVVRQRLLDGEISVDSSRYLLAELDAQIHALDEAPEVALAGDALPGELPDPDTDRAQHLPRQGIT